MSQGDIEEDEYYQPGDYIGKMGIEREYEKDLRGVKGVQILLRVRMVRYKVAIRMVSMISVHIPDGTFSLVLMLIFKPLANVLMEGKLGAIVAIEPKTGQILAMVSAPTFRPSCHDR